MRDLLEVLSGYGKLMLMIIALSGTAADLNASSDEDAKIVAALDTKYQAAVKSNDAATMDQILADDFVLVNEHTGASLTPHSSQVPSYDGSTAEVISEVPRIDGQWTYLSNFGHFLVDNDEAAYGNSSPVPFNQLTSVQNQILNVFNGDTLMAGPGNFISGGSNFNMFFNACK